MVAHCIQCLTIMTFCEMNNKNEWTCLIRNLKVLIFPNAIHAVVAANTFYKLPCNHKTHETQQDNSKPFEIAFGAFQFFALAPPHNLLANIYACIAMDQFRLEYLPLHCTRQDINKRHQQMRRAK